MTRTRLVSRMSSERNYDNLKRSIVGTFAIKFQASTGCEWTWTEGREKVRVSLLGPQPSPATPGVLLLEPIAPPIGHPIDMAASPAELLTTHSEHTTPAYHTQI
ncbi:cAMP-dependent protein kinase catalytic subunit-like, partial [Vespula squamosa]